MSFSRWRSVALFTGLAIVAALTVASVTGYPMRHYDFGRGLLLTLAAVLMVWPARLMAYIYRLWRAGVENPIAALRADFPQEFPRLVSVALSVILISVFLQSISSIKFMMTAVVPFWADSALLAFDRALIGDVQLIAQSIQPAMPALDWFYWSWQMVNLLGIIWVLHWSQRLTLAYMLTWAIGMAAAYLGSSAGPIFYGSYDPSLAPETIRRVSQGLWNNHISQGSMIGSGISAFPSMHVAIAVWFAFVLKEKGLGWIGWAYACGIWISSVLVGWHYILDGVGGALAAWIAYEVIMGSASDQAPKLTGERASTKHDLRQSHAENALATVPNHAN